MSGRLTRFATMCVLIVDDKPANVELLRAVLREEGLTQIATETDSRRVPELLPLIDPDLILLDLHMPHLDGNALLAMIATFAAGTYLPVIVLTADVTRRARNRALSSGAHDFLTKPLDNTEVVLRVANVLETRQLYGSLRQTARAAAEPNGSHPAADPSGVTDVLRYQRLRPVFQPIIDVATMSPVGWEALSRFAAAHPRGPAGWFSDAFAIGCGIELESLAISLALPFMDSMPPETLLAVNMSPATVMSLNENRSLLPDASLSRLVVELTEHVPIEDYSALQLALRPLRARGARVAADDLGAGYAGFRHLLALDPDIIKLDISIVRDIDQSRSARALASALVAFAGDVDATVIGEGVETDRELRVLQDIGVPWAQGFFLGRPAERALP